MRGNLWEDVVGVEGRSKEGFDQRWKVGKRRLEEGKGLRSQSLEGKCRRLLVRGEGKG